jgi:transposase InsO family protein
LFLGHFEPFLSPQPMHSDNGPEFVARAIRQWLEVSGGRTLYIEPGAPWENAYSETFISRFSEELLKREVKAIRVTSNKREDWVAVPVPDAGISREWVDAAQAAIKDNVRPSRVDERSWELKGVLFCPCGNRMVPYNSRRGGKRYHLLRVLSLPPRGTLRLRTPQKLARRRVGTGSTAVRP